MIIVLTPAQFSPLDGEENRRQRMGWTTIGFPALEGRGLGEGVHG